jgi:hypothetical protein
VFAQFEATDLEDMYIPLEGFFAVKALVSKEYPQYMDKFNTFATDDDVWYSKGIKVQT